MAWVLTAAIIVFFMVRRISKRIYIVVTTHNYAESWIFVPGDSLCKDHQ